LQTIDELPKIVIEKKLLLPDGIFVLGEVFKFLETCTEQYDFIFAGPPYALQTIDELPKIVIGKKLLLPDGIFVLEHTPRNKYEGYPGFVKQRNYGTTVFSFFEQPDVEQSDQNHDD